MEFSIISSLWFLLAGLASYIILSKLKHNTSNHGKLPPGPSPIPIFGNLFQLGTNPHKSLTELAKTYGPVMTLRLGQVITVVVSSSTAAKEVFQKNDVVLSNRWALEFVRALNYNENSIIWASPTAQWRFFRKISHTLIFLTSGLDAGQNLREKKVAELLSYVQKSSEKRTAVDIGQVVSITTLNLLSNTFFSTDLVELTSTATNVFEELLHTLLADAGAPNFSDFFSIIKPLDLQGVKRRATVTISKMVNIFDSIINQRLSERKCDQLQKNDVLDVLLNLSEVNNNELKRSHIPYILTDLFAAGSETTTTTLEWAMAELLRHPEKLKKAQEELEMIIGKGNQVKEAQLPQLTYLQSIIKETLRLYPPVPFLIPRKADANVELCGHIVPKDAQVWINSRAIGRDPSQWENPDSFEPERFLGSEVDFKGQHFELLPFGAGRRICPGIPLATRSLPLILGSLIHSFDWDLENKVNLESLNMEDRFTITIKKVHPLRAIPIQRLRS
ncbi:Geraniol 8-hydroxylase-like protein [Drosera capensis]